MTSVTKALILVLPVVLVAACADRSAQTATTTTVARPMAAPAPMEPVQTQTTYQRSLRK